jgi:bacterioferritin
LRGVTGRSDRSLKQLHRVALKVVAAVTVDAEMCAHWGYGRLASRFHGESIGELNDAKELIERILYLEGVPNMQPLGSVRVGGMVPEKLSLALDLETERLPASTRE